LWQCIEQEVNVARAFAFVIAQRVCGYKDRQAAFVWDRKGEKGVPRFQHLPNKNHLNGDGSLSQLCREHKWSQAEQASRRWWNNSSKECF